VPAITKQYEDILALIKGMIFAPAGRFYTDANYLSFINTAATQYANDIGGLHLVDDTIQTVAAQSRYALDSRHKAIRKAAYMTNYGQETETYKELEILDDPAVNYLRAVSSALDPTTGYSYDVTGNPVEVPKFLLARPEQNLIILVDPPMNAGDTLRLHTRSLPSVLGPGVTWDGDERDQLAIAYLVCSLGRMRSRDSNESGIFDQKYASIVQAYKRARAKENQVMQMRDGRFLNSNLKSVNGAF
jgi:hypothetical protein